MERMAGWRRKTLALTAAVSVLSSVPITHAQGAEFTTILAEHNDPYMALLVEGEISAGDAAGLRTALDAAAARYTDRRMRALALNSPGGLISKAKRMANIIRAHGLVTVVPERAQCASACILLFASGPRKIASTGAFIGVHSASDANGVQTTTALAATTLLAKDLAAFGVPGSIIARAVVTPPEQMTQLSREEIEMMPWGVVQKFDLKSVPIALAGLDSELRRGTAPRTIPFYQEAGPSLPSPVPPSDTFSAAPPHNAALIKRATDFSTGYTYGFSAGNRADCARAAAGGWHKGCLAGSYEREKFVDKACRGQNGSDPLAAAIDRDHCPAGQDRQTETAEDWLRAFDEAYTTKTGQGQCGNGVAPSNDGCRAGAVAWARTEPNGAGVGGDGLANWRPAPGAQPFSPFTSGKNSH